MDLSVTRNALEGGSNQPIGISGEYTNNVGLGVLRGILMRVPKVSKTKFSSWLHVVYCTKLQDEYWTKDLEDTWENFRHTYEIDDLCLLRVSTTKNGSLQL